LLKIEVKRNRASVTQGNADIYINGEKVITFGDDMFLKLDDGNFTNGFRTVENATHYGEVIGGWGSIKPDSDFIFGLLYHPYDNIYHYTEIVGKAILAADKEVHHV
jgi:hypothetical protein